MVVDKTRDSTNSKIWPDSTCAISVRRKGQILLVVEPLVLSTTCKGQLMAIIIFIFQEKTNKARSELIVDAFSERKNAK